MYLSLESKPAKKRKNCPSCKKKFVLLTHYILKDGEPYAVSLSQCHRHDNRPELFFTIVFGDWNTEDHENNLTFACRYGDVISNDEMACTLVDIPEVYKTPFSGTLLNRSEAINHPRIKEFWKAVDYLLTSDKQIHDQLFHNGNKWIKWFN